MKVQVPRTLGLGGLLFELLLPVALSASVLFAVAGYTRSWDLHSRLGLGIFVALLVVLSLIVSLRLDMFTLARRRRRGKAQLLNRADSRSRYAKLVLGGLAIPVLAFVAANRFELPNHQTPMALALQLRLTRPETVHAEQIASVVLRSPHSAAKVQGISALQALGSDEALDQLLRILSDDPWALKDGAESQALSKALAAYGPRAKTRLLSRLAQVAPGAGHALDSPQADLFDRYFSSAFDGARSEIEGANSDEPAQARSLERLQVARADLERALRQIETEAQPDLGATGLPGFVLRTLLQMDGKQDPEILEVGRRIAADARWPSAVRGQALLLIAKLGDKDVLDEVFGYLESPDPLLQARAMQAIAVLQAKLSAAGAAH